MKKTTSDKIIGERGAERLVRPNGTVPVELPYASAAKLINTYLAFTSYAVYRSYLDNHKNKKQ